jgi:hypothetical protein
LQGCSQRGCRLQSTWRTQMRLRRRTGSGATPRLGELVSHPLGCRRRIASAAGPDTSPHRRRCRSSSRSARREIPSSARLRGFPISSCGTRRRSRRKRRPEQGAAGRHGGPASPASVATGPQQVQRDLDLPPMTFYGTPRGWHSKVGKPFPTMDRAGCTALVEIQEGSLGNDLEYAGNVYATSGGFASSAPVKGTNVDSDPSASPIPSGGTRKATYHSHAGGYNPTRRTLLTRGQAQVDVRQAAFLPADATRKPVPLRPGEPTPRQPAGPVPAGSCHPAEVPLLTAPPSSVS